MQLSRAAVHFEILPREDPFRRARIMPGETDQVTLDRTQKRGAFVVLAQIVDRIDRLKRRIELRELRTELVEFRLKLRRFIRRHAREHDGGRTPESEFGNVAEHAKNTYT